jgi:protein-tyrosine phosphatase
MERRVALDGALNFRDLGGYPAEAGATTRWGCVYRSDGLDQLSDADLEQLRQLGIRLACDLRDDREVRDAPSRLAAQTGVRALRLPIGEDPAAEQPLVERILTGAISEFTVEQMTDLYMGMLDVAAPVFACIIELAADPANHPMVFHCTAGKDRTGVAAALLLGVLGVADEVLLDDYELTAVYRSAIRIEELRPRLEAAGVDVEAIRSFLSAEPAVLAATLAHIRVRWGSIEAYLLGAGGLDPATIQRARATMLDFVTPGL